MKHKVLINGKSQNVVSDFFRQTEYTFDTLSTSPYPNDIAGHFRFFKPDVYVYFVDLGYDQAVKHITDLKNSNYFNGAAIIIVGDGDTCDRFERSSKGLADVLIRRPVSVDNLTLRITRYLEDHNIERSNQAAFNEKTSQVDALIQAAEAALSSAAAAANPAESSVRKHILVVDDDRTVLKMLKSALEGTYDVTTMANGAMIDKLLSAKKVDMIILDYEMPIESGAEIFRRIRKKTTAANIPVCFLTGVSDREKIMEVMSLKPNGYILKPIDMDALTSTIKSLIG